VSPSALVGPDFHRPSLTRRTTYGRIDTFTSFSPEVFLARRVDPDVSRSSVGLRASHASQGPRVAGMPDAAQWRTQQVMGLTSETAGDR